MYGLALRVLRSPVLAEEAALETYLEAWRTSARFDAAESSPVAWILVLVLRRILDRLGPAYDATRSPAPMSTYTLGDDFRRRHLTPSTAEEELREALAWLTPGQRAALVLACGEGYDVESAHLTAILSTLASANSRESQDPVADPRFVGS